MSTSVGTAALVALVAVGSGALGTSRRAPGLPLSFSLVSFKAGDLDRHCAAELERARALGFASVTLVPYLGFDPRAGRVVSGATLRPGELRRCLERIRRSGLDLLYKPHLGHLQALRGDAPAIWRAHFTLRSTARYETELFEPVLRWLHDHRRELARRDHWAVDLVLAHEMERSTVRQPGLWQQALRRLRYRLLASGLHVRVRVGLGLNWRPVYPARGPGRRRYARLLRACDFLAASLYGDWSELYPRALADHLEAFRRRLRTQVVDADWPAVARVPLIIGEFAVGGDLSRTEHEMPLGPRAIKRRRRIFRQLLRWARRGPASRAGARPLPLVLWTVGLFDPVGVSAHRGRRRVDPAIVGMIRKIPNNKLLR